MYINIYTFRYYSTILYITYIMISYTIRYNVAWRISSKRMTVAEVVACAAVSFALSERMLWGFPRHHCDGECW